MEENLLNELENFTSIKYLDDVTNNNTNYCNDDDEQQQVKLTKLFNFSIFQIILF